MIRTLRWRPTTVVIALIATLATVCLTLAARPVPAQAATGNASVTFDSSAKWIGRDTPFFWPENGKQNPAPLLRKTFTTSGQPAKATLTIVGLGLYVAWINGQRVGDQVLEPAPSQYNKTAFARSYDVTSLLRSGNNAIGALLGRGYFGMPGTRGDTFNYPSAPWRSEPRLIAQLDVTGADGRTQRVVTDGTWRIADSGTRDNFYLGESFQASAQPSGWALPEFNDSGWQNARVQTAPTKQVVRSAQAPMRVQDTLAPTSVTTLPNGDRRYDFGQITAGWARLRVSGPAGTTVRMLYGEQLEKDGRVNQYQADQDPDRHVDSYTLDGQASQTWEPNFTRHGFRYIQLSSTQPLTSVQLEARVVHNDLAEAGSLSLGNELLTSMHNNQLNSLRSAMANIPLDTPWRDRQGWTADAYLYLDSMALNFDVEDFYADWLRSFRETQSAMGSVPVIAPDPGALPLYDDPSWSGTLITTPWALYGYYGDKALLADNYAAMKAWMNRMSFFLQRTGYIHAGYSFGDWAPPGAEANGISLFAPESSNITATADLYQQNLVLAQIARTLGKPTEAKPYEDLAAKIKAAFIKRFFNAATASFVTEPNFLAGFPAPSYRQTSALVALSYGLVPDGKEQAVVDALVSDIRARGTHLNTGAIGTRLLLPVLSDHGYGELAYDLATQTTYPSWGYWVKQGATSSWETWDIRSPLQSLNHSFQGTFEGWLYQYLVGIKPAAPGYQGITVAPLMPKNLPNAAGTLRTRQGEVSVSWKRTADGITVEVTAPAGVRTEVRLPVRDRGADPGPVTTTVVTGGTHTFQVPA